MIGRFLLKIELWIEFFDSPGVFRTIDRPRAFNAGQKLMLILTNVHRINLHDFPF